jgi:hypothetical protein
MSSRKEQKPWSAFLNSNDDRPLQLASCLLFICLLFLVKRQMKTNFISATPWASVACVAMVACGFVMSSRAVMSRYK